MNPAFGGAQVDLVTEYEDLLEWATNIGALQSNQMLAGSLRTLLSLAGTIAGVRTEYRDGNGTLVQAAEFVYAVPVQGSGTATKPYQTSVVSSLLTGRPGRSRRGRLYWPALGATIGAGDLRLATPSTATTADGVRTTLLGIEAAAPTGTNPRLCVVSETLSVATPVTQIAVGNILDVQRRRRDSLVEAISTALYPGA